MIIKMFFLSAALLVLIPTIAQTDYRSSTVTEKPAFYRIDSLPGERAIRFPVTGMILPAALIAYGFIVPHLDGLTDINENVKYDAWTKSPHKTVPYDTYLQFAPAAAVYALNWAGVKGQHDFVDRSMIYFISNVIMGISVYAIKSATHVQRPDGSGFNSFPSGHASEAFVSAEFLRQEYADQSIWYGVGGYAVASTVAYLRIYNNKHWLNDVVAGAGFGIASTRVAYWIYPKIRKAFYHTVFKKSVLLPYYQSGSGGIAFQYTLP